MPIAPATASDREVLIALLDAADLPHEDLVDADLRHFRVLRRDGTVRGVVGIEPAGSAALLRSLVVRPADRGQGIGQALVRAAEGCARGQDIEALYLLTTTAADFFAALGYDAISREEVPVAIARTDEFERLCPATATCMQKALTSYVPCQP
jgi:amino-acid N-acetyltransferase